MGCGGSKPKSFDEMPKAKDRPSLPISSIETKEEVVTKETTKQSFV
jgi:hypothetical protein